MTDIVERLVTEAQLCGYVNLATLLEEAADEIERLRLELAQAKLAEDAAANLEAEILRLRELLRDWLEFAKDVKPGCAAGADWLESLRKRTALAPGDVK
jgi:hypothetical protein